jgi:threonine dehydrogenase-like Zn-dependent dehydrogenase
MTTTNTRREAGPTGAASIRTPMLIVGAGPVGLGPAIVFAYIAVRHLAAEGAH